MNCPTCNKEFVPKNKVHKYCKPECTPSYIKAQATKLANQTRVRNMIPCATCGVKFEQKNINHKYCKAVCRPLTDYEVYRDYVWNGEPEKFVHPLVMAVLRRHHKLIGYE